MVLAIFGSLGDLYPFIALALELAARGHHPVIASSESLRSRVEQAGIEFRPIQPDATPPTESDSAAHFPKDALRSAHRHFHQNILSHLRATYEDLFSVCQDADILVSHRLVYVAPLVAEKLRMRWAEAILTPSDIWSIYDFPVLSGQPVLTWFCRRSRLVAKLALATGRASLRRVLRPVDELWAAVGLAPQGRSVSRERFSPHLRLALFSPLLARPQKDWPPDTRVTGSVFYNEGMGRDALPADLEAFVGSGPPPIVFTLGSLLWTVARDFYDVSAAAATALGYRAVLRIDPSGRQSIPVANGVICAAYAPYAALFARAAAIVHHGGMGTLGLALRAGRPSLVVPFALDQPDNAARAVRLGVARTIPRHRYTVDQAMKDLGQLLSNPAYAARAAEVARLVQDEDGVGVACDAIEACLMRVEIGQVSTHCQKLRKDLRTW